MFFLLARFYARPISYKALILAFQLNIFNEKGVICVEEEKFGLPVDVRGSKTSVLSSLISERGTTCILLEIEPSSLTRNNHSRM